MDNELLCESWKMRNAATTMLMLTEEQMRHAVQEADVTRIISLIETFTPARSAGPEWTRTLEPLMERLWAWRDDETMAVLAEAFRARGMPWVAVTNALSPEFGAQSRANARQPAWARLPAFSSI